MLSLQSRTRMSAMPSLNPKIVWFPGPQHALFNSYFKLFQLCRCPWLLSLNQNRAPETSDQAQTHFPRLSKCIWHSIILDFNAVAAHEIAPKMLEFACHAAKNALCPGFSKSGAQCCPNLYWNAEEWLQGPQHALSRPGRKHLVAPVLEPFLQGDAGFGRRLRELDLGSGIGARGSTQQS